MCNTLFICMLQYCRPDFRSFSDESQMETNSFTNKRGNDNIKRKTEQWNGAFNLKIKKQFLEGCW